MNRAQERAELERQVAEYTQTGDLELKQDLLKGYQWLVIGCARRLNRGVQSLGELIQVGNVGLLLALKRYKPEKGLFVPYAAATITGMLRHHHRAGWRLTTVRRIQDLYIAVGKAVDLLTQQLHRSPTTQEVAEYLGVSMDAVLEALDAGVNFFPKELQEWDQPSVERQREPQAAIDSEVDVQALLNRLPLLKREILRLRYFENKTQAEIGEIVGYSQVHISRLMQEAIIQLRAYGDAWDEEGESK